MSRALFSLMIAGFALGSASAVAATEPARSTTLAEVAMLALFGSGIIGLAALVRRHFSR